MSSHVGCSRSISPHLVHCQDEPTRFVNGLKNSSKVGGAFLVLISRNSPVDCRTVLVHISPFIVGSRMFLTSCLPWRRSASYYGSRSTCCSIVWNNAEIWLVYYDISSSSNDIYTTMHELYASFVHDSFTTTFLPVVTTSIRQCTFCTSSSKP